HRNLLPRPRSSGAPRRLAIPTRDPPRKSRCKTNRARRRMIDILNNLPRTPPTNTGRIAAFFDIDGTLLAGPSLECRLFANLRYRRVVPARNYFLWLAHSFRLAPRGLQAVLHANKMYLRGVIALSSTGTPVHHEARRVYSKLRRACVNV